MPYQAGFLKRGNAMRSLSRGYSQATDGRELRAVPHGEGVERRHSADQPAHESFPVDWGARRAELRFVPQERGGRAVPRTFNRVLLLPSERLC